MHRWLLFPALLLAAAGSSSAAVEEVAVKVKGLACPFCAFNVEKRVKTLDGVDAKARVRVSIETGWVRVPWNGKPFRLETFRKAIVEAGFTPGEVTLVASGTVVYDKTRTALALEGRIPLFAGARAQRKQIWDSLRAAASTTKGGIPARVEGLVRTGKQGWIIELRRWTPRDYKAEVTVAVETFACERCSTRTMQVLEKLDGVIHARADHEKNRVRVWTKGDTPDPAAIREAIEKAGFTVKTIKRRLRGQSK